MLVVLLCSINCVSAAGHEHRLHVALGLGEVEELAAVGVAAHLDEPLGLVVADVGQRAGGDFQVRIAAAVGGGHHRVGQLQQPLLRLGVLRIELGAGLRGHGGKEGLGLGIRDWRKGMARLLRGRREAGQACFIVSSQPSRLYFVVEHIGVNVGAVRPDNRTELRIDANRAEDGRIVATSARRSARGDRSPGQLPSTSHR